jgi:hypothetical protein
LRFLRHAVEYARRDEISDLSIRRELQIFNINKITDKEKEWHGHIQRIDPYRISRKAEEYKPMGHRDVGRPKRRRKTTFEDSYVIGTHLMVYNDVDGDKICIYLLHYLFYEALSCSGYTSSYCTERLSH